MPDICLSKNVSARRAAARSAEGAEARLARNRWPAGGAWLLLLCAPWLFGCSTVSYYAQAVGGHLSLMSDRVPVSEVLENPETDDTLRQKLQLLIDARRYAVDRLGLPENDSYGSYVETGRDYVTWNVVAAPEFSLSPKTWCFPVAGCVSYRGYFDEQDALEYSDAIATEGFDTTVGGATAYSTLGWFDDPILDTMLRGSDIRLVGILFHELAHQELYVQDDSNFNEAFASFVEQAGTRQWLKDHDRENEIERYDAHLERRAQFAALLKSTREALSELYAEPLDEATMRTRKQAVFDSMREQYAELKSRWGGYSGYDGWFERELNNARLVAVATYRKWVPAFEEIFRQEQADFPAFYARASALAEMDKKARTAALTELLK